MKMTLFGLLLLVATVAGAQEAPLPAGPAPGTGAEEEVEDVEKLVADLTKVLRRAVAQQRAAVSRLDKQCRKLEKPLDLPLLTKPLKKGVGKGGGNKGGAAGNYQQQLKQRATQDAQRRVQLAKAREALAAARDALREAKLDLSRTDELGVAELKALAAKYSQGGKDVPRGGGRKKSGKR